MERLTIDTSLDRLEAEEQRIWAQVRRRGSFTSEQAQFLARLDARRGYTKTPGERRLPTYCWQCDQRLTAREADHWWQQLTTGKISHGPYCGDHTRT